MKKNFNTAMDSYNNIPIVQLGVKRRVAYFKSKTKSKVTYKTERHRTGLITCFCPASVYRGTCRHKERAKTWK